MNCLQILIILFCTFQIAARSNEEISDEFDLDGLLYDNDFESSRFFKSSARMKSPSEVWPERFYRKMSICHIKPRSVYKVEGTCQNPNATIATGLYRNAQNETGWGILEIETFPGFPQEMQAYAAGLVEGILAKVQIYYHYVNTVKEYCKNESEYCQKLYRYLNANLQWIDKQVHNESNNDIYWRHVNLTFIQLTGINDGYIADKQIYTPNMRFNMTPVFMMQLAGDFYDLEHVFGKKTKQSRAGHCSAIVKVTDENRDLLSSHVTWSGYHTMNRVAKLYKFVYDRKEVPGNTIAYSGYPGVLSSTDDYTLTNAGLLSLETTIDIFNKTLYQLFVKPEGQLLCWVRSYIANQLAATAHDWVKIFARYNSGTYNNEWTLTTNFLNLARNCQMQIWFGFLNKFRMPKIGTLLQNFRGNCISRDITWFLRKYGYWPSYNIPYLSKISALSGYERKGNNNSWWRWGSAPRGRIFQRDHEKVQNLTTLRELMRYNDYMHDEFSRCKCTPPYTAEAAISARNDLNPVNGTWEIPEMADHNMGAIDYKGTNFELFKRMRIELVGGPTFGGPGNLPMFSWANTNIEATHLGQSEDWNFDSFVTLWRTPINMDIDE